MSAAWRDLHTSYTFYQHREPAVQRSEIAQAEVCMLRQRLWKVGAVVTTSVRRIWFHVSTTWPHCRLLERVYAAVQHFVASLRREVRILPNAGLLPLL